MKEIPLLIQAEMKKRKEAAYKERDRRVEMLSSQYPEYRSLRTEMRNCNFSLLLMLQKRDQKSLEEIVRLKETYTQLKQAKDAFLREHGIPVDYDSLHFRCSKCKDEGFIYDDRNIRQKCSCYVQEEIRYKYAFSGLDKVLEKENFDTFDETLFSDQKEEGQGISPRERILLIKQGMLKYVADFAKEEKNLLFYGESGRGKTFMSHAIARELLNQNRSVVYKTYYDILDHIRSSQFDHGEEKNEEMEDYLLSDFLIIDDLGAEITTEYAVLQLFHILNKRILLGKKFLISSNLDLKELRNTYGDRIFSRIAGTSYVFKFVGEDIRLKKNANRSGRDGLK